MGPGSPLGAAGQAKGRAPWTATRVPTLMAAGPDSGPSPHPSPRPRPGHRPRPTTGPHPYLGPETRLHPNADPRRAPGPRLRASPDPHLGPEPRPAPQPGTHLRDDVVQVAERGLVQQLLRQRRPPNHLPQSLLRPLHHRRVHGGAGRAPAGPLSLSPAPRPPAPRPGRAARVSIPQCTGVRQGACAAASARSPGRPGLSNGRAAAPRPRPPAARARGGVAFGAGSARGGGVCAGRGLFDSRRPREAGTAPHPGVRGDRPPQDCFTTTRLPRLVLPVRRFQEDRTKLRNAE